MSTIRQGRLVALREMRERSRSRAFRASLVVMVLVVAAVIILPSMLGGGGTKDVGLAGKVPTELANAIQSASRRRQGQDTRPPLRHARGRRTSRPPRRHRRSRRQRSAVGVATPRRRAVACRRHRCHPAGRDARPRGGRRHQTGAAPPHHRTGSGRERPARPRHRTQRRRRNGRPRHERASAHGHRDLRGPRVDRRGRREGQPRRRGAPRTHPRPHPFGRQGCRHRAARARAGRGDRARRARRHRHSRFLQCPRRSRSGDRVGRRLVCPRLRPLRHGVRRARLPRLAYRGRPKRRRTRDGRPHRRLLRLGGSHRKPRHPLGKTRLLLSCNRTVRDAQSHRDGRNRLVGTVRCRGAHADRHRRSR